MAEEEDLVKRYNALYLEIILKYKDYIEEQESLYVAELPNLVTPNDDVVVGVANRIKSGFPIYNYEENFHDAAKAAYEHVKNEIYTVELPVQFWLTPRQTETVGAGDIFDKAVLLCSLLIALGNPSSKVIVIITDSERKFLNYAEFDGRVIAIDFDKGIIEFKSIEEMMSYFSIKKGKDVTAYEFNDKMYNDLA
ncbi:MAG: hypothetical protein QXZ38_02330 [Candidatus Micrarchaeaceae archaeon]